MNKQELIGQVADSTGLSRGDASRAVETVFDTISNALKRGDEVRLVGFGTFLLAPQGFDRAQPPHASRAIKEAHPSPSSRPEGPQEAGTAELVRWTDETCAVAIGRLRREGVGA